jgi:hypothetical protein
MGLYYKAPPTVSKFARSDAFGRVILGPVGSGKTVGMVMELLRRAIQQTPGQDGLRHTRFAIVRQTLKQLKDTVLKDCHQWVGQLGHWKVSDTTYHLDFEDVRSELVFIPLEDSDDQARLLSMQLTGAWLSEVIEMDISILGPISGRMPRYPSGADGNPTWHGIIADTNFPTEGTPWHEFFENPRPNWSIFKQPSGLSEDAENLNYLGQTDTTALLPIDHPDRIAQGRKYYDRYVEMYGIEHPWVQRYVRAQYGPDPSGMAVFQKTFVPAMHVSDETFVIPGYPLIVGQDFGRNPWSVICQPDHWGRLLVHEEVEATNIGLEKHIEEHLKPRLMQERYLGCKVAVVGDPAGVAKGSIGEETSFEVLQRLGLPAFPAPTNLIDPRLRAVETYLGRMVQGKGAMLFDRQRCPQLIRGMNGTYRFAKTKLGQARSLPDKNEASHPQDGLQYVALVCHGGMVSEIARRLTPRVRARRERPSAKGWT